MSNNKEMKSLVIANSGRPTCGKSTAIKAVWKLLTELYPKSYTILSEKNCYDIKGIVEIDGIKVGIESQGDPESRMLGTVEEFNKIGCKIIVVACRMSGGTFKKVDTYLHTDYHWDVMWFSHIIYDTGLSNNEQEVRDSFIQEYAKRVVELIHDRINGKI